MKKKFFIIIAVIHLLLVVGNMAIYSDIFNQKNDDSQRYVRVAKELASFNFSNADAYLSCCTAPGYPLFLAIFKVITRLNNYMVAISQALLYIIALYYLLLQLHKKGYLSYPLCVAAFFLVLVCPDVFESNGRTLSESFCGSMILLIVGSVINGFDKTSVKIIFVIAVSFLMLARFEYLVILPFLLLFLIYKKRYLFTAVTVLAVVIVVSANGYRNYRTYGIFNPLSFGAGTVIYGGNNMNGDGSWHIIEKDINYIPKAQQEKYLSIKSKEWKCRCPEEDSFYKEQAFEAWKGNVMFQLKIIPLKFMKLWSLPGIFDYHSGLTKYKKGMQMGILFDSNIWPWYGKYKHGFYLAVYWLFLLMIIAGFFLKIKEKKFDLYDLSVILLFLIITFLYSVPFYGLSRFHVPVFGLMAIYSSFTVKYFYKQFCKRDLIKILYK
ncbi:MAG TPA: hypothetical protein PKN48_04160 [Bacteroidales bacterium]|nr:hypothetical protein [Bacteroidales bacterium]